MCQASSCSSISLLISSGSTSAFCKHTNTVTHSCTARMCDFDNSLRVTNYVSRKEKYLLGFQQQLRNCVDRGFCASLCSLFFFCALILSVLPRVLLVPLPLHLHLTAVHTLNTKEKVGIRMKTEGGGTRKGKRKKEGRGRKKRERKKKKKAGSGRRKDVGKGRGQKWNTKKEER